MIDEEKIYRYLKKAEKLAASVGDKPLCLGFSGGKDSIVLKYFADKFGIKYEARYNNTQIEQWTGMLPFIKKHYPDVVIVNPSKDKSFFVQMVKNGEPLLFRRWCCNLLKHGNPKNKEYKIGVFGVRGAESRNRLKRGDMNVLNNSQRAQRRQAHLREEFNRQDTEIRCYGDNGEKVNIYPIFDLTDEEVWQVIRENNLPIPQPYLDGSKRIGCALCPFASRKDHYAIIETNPNLVKQWLKAKQTQYITKSGGCGLENTLSDYLIFGDKYLDVVAYFWLFINNYVNTKKTAIQGIRKYKQEDLFGNSEEKKFRELLMKHKIIRDDGSINLPDIKPYNND